MKDFPSSQNWSIERLPQACLDPQQYDQDCQTPTKQR